MTGFISGSSAEAILGIGQRLIGAVFFLYPTAGESSDFSRKNRKKIPLVRKGEKMV